MPKLFYTQGTAVLFEAAPSLADLRRALEGFEIVKESADCVNWALSGPHLVLPYRPEANGYCTIDVVDRPWPDGMGPLPDEPMLFAAWGMGHFGPFTYPRALERARSQCWNWPQAESLVTEHKAFVRVRHTYCVGAREGESLRKGSVPEDCDPLDELRHAITLALRIMVLDGAIALFNPNGECLSNIGQVEAALSRSDRRDMQELWCNVRMFNDGRGNLIFDTKGLGQVDLVDHEVVILGGKCDADEIAVFLRNIASYVIGHTGVIEDGDTVDGPGGKKWRCKHQAESTLPGPREVMAWAPAKKWFGR